MNEFLRTFPARCYVKPGEKDHGYAQWPPRPPPPLVPLEFLIRLFSGHCPRKWRTAAGPTPRGAPKTLRPLLPPAGRFFLFIFLSSLFSRIFCFFFFYFSFFPFVISVGPRAPFPRSLALEEVYRLTRFAITQRYTGVSRRCLIARKRNRFISRFNCRAI